MINHDSIRAKLPDLVLGKLTDFENEVIHNYLIDNEELMQEYLDLCASFDSVAGLDQEPSFTDDQRREILAAVAEVDKENAAVIATKEKEEKAKRVLHSEPIKKGFLNWQRVVYWASAACFICILSAMLFPTFGKMQRKSSAYRDSSEIVVEQFEHEEVDAPWGEDEMEDMGVSVNMNAPASSSYGSLSEVDEEEEVDLPSLDIADFKSPLKSEYGARSKKGHGSAIRSYGGKSDGDLAFAEKKENSQFKLEDFKDETDLDSLGDSNALDDNLMAHNSAETNWKWSEPSSKKVVAPKPAREDEAGRKKSDRQLRAEVTKEVRILEKAHIGFVQSKAKKKVRKSKVSIEKQRQEALEKAHEELKKERRRIQLQDRRKMISPLQQAESTFRLHVNTASFKLVERALNNHRDYDEAAVRPEEFINHFNYRYSQPAYGVFSIAPEVLKSPIATEEKVYLRVGLQASRIGIDKRRPMNTIILLDTSGSMAVSNRLPMIKSSLSKQTKAMRQQDRVHLLTEAKSWINLSSQTATDELLSTLEASGPTDLALLLQKGMKQAQRLYEANPASLQRIVLISDGYADEEVQIESFIDQSKLRQASANLSVIGLGLAASQRQDLRRLSEASDGFFYLIKTREEAERVFAEQMSATAQIIAEDVKMQVAFNPQTVQSYRLVGYEDRHIAAQDFRNDKINSGEVRSGQAATALYELVIKDSADEEYWAEVRLRYRNREDGKIEEINRRVRGEKAQIVHFNKASSAARTAVIAGRYAELLRYGGKKSALRQLLKLCGKLSREDEQNLELKQLKQMIAQSIRR